MTRQLPVVGSLRADGRRERIVPADVSGRFMSSRMLVFGLLMVVYLALPWVSVRGRPLVLFHVARREAFLFGLTFNAQDVWMLVFVLTGAAFALVVATTLLGRVWCGWGCPQTVWIEGLFRPLERWIEGSREKRLRRTASWDLLWRKIVLHALWVVAALLLAHAFLAYFMPVRDVLTYVRSTPMAHPGTFVFVMALAGILYFDFAWFREQFCVVMCPYGRMQGLLIDEESLVIGYDEKRGEPRGKKGAKGAGDCVDCKRCVVVCPTGIDIRNGLQMDCIGCAACIDACDDIMTRLGRARGLVRYDSQSGLAGKPRKFLRPRLALYGFLGVAGLAASVLAFSQQRHGFEANLLRAAGAPYQIEAGQVRNGFHVHLVNKFSERTTFELEPIGNAQFLVPLRKVELAPLAGADVPFFVSVPRDSFVAGMPATLRIVPIGRGEARVLPVQILGPAP